MPYGCFHLRALLRRFQTLQSQTSKLSFFHAHNKLPELQDSRQNLLTWNLCCYYDISEEEAVLFISDDENNELKQFLANDYTLQFKYDRLKERGVL